MVIDIEQRKFERKIIIIMWSFIVVFNFILTILSPSISGWIVSGFAVGMLLSILITNPLLASRERLINIQNSLIDFYRKDCNILLREVLKKEIDKIEKNNVRKAKKRKVKGGKKK